MKKTIEERFWSKVDKNGPAMPGMESCCWVWTNGARNHDGYGKFTATGKTKIASRAAWEFSKGPIPVGMCVCHRCDNPPCCNPAHLWLGTNAQNISDRDVKKRNNAASGNRHGTHTRPDRVARGERQGSAKLTEEDVKRIRVMVALGEPQKKTAIDFGVSRSLIGLIVKRKIWSHVQ